MIFGLINWRFLAAAVLILGLVAQEMVYGEHRYRQGVAATVAADAKVLAVATAHNTELEARWAAQQKDATDAYNREIDRLQPIPGPAVRLCYPAPRGALPRTPAATGGTRAGAAPAGVVQPGAGPDIGQDLRALAFKADRLSAQLRAILLVCR